ncbi:MAG TPA: glycosyltransferase family 39 protein [Polyangia bacterium]|jgi:4-amino-4-deoxy-L-arabinose transferase-like glycosyltransferase
MIAALVAIATALRVAWVLLVPTRPVGDFALYVESAAHLLSHGAFDPAFIYMPGYVVALAGVQALGGGLLAAKLLGAAVGGLGAWPVAGLAARLFDRRAGWVAGALYAGWPAGIAVASVTGTDLPTGVLLATAVYQLVRWRADRPWTAAILFGLVSGLAATVRAIAAPLAALSLFFWLASRVRPSQALARTAVSCALAVCVLLPWGIRNQRRYGEFFLTDSHGGHTALVGANPDTDGVYSRSLNLMFWKGTGFKLFEPPHRQSDRAAYDLALAWARFEPAYAAGLVVAKADRLLTSEQPLLYWPIYRQGVLSGGARDFFASVRRPLEGIVEGFWYALLSLAAIGVVVAAAERRWPALSVLLFPLVLTILYATFFSEARYHLAIVVFLFPFAGAAVSSVLGGFSPTGLGRRWRPVLAAILLLATIFIGWPALVRAGSGLRDRHRWAVCVCAVDGQSRLCQWKPAVPAPGEGRSPVRGVWNGVGLLAPAGGARVAAAATFTDLPAGQYRFTAIVDQLTDDLSSAPRVIFSSDGRALAAATLSAPGDTTNASSAQPIEGVIDHGGGNLHLEFTVAATARTTVWLSDLRIARLGPGQHE